MQSSTIQTRVAQVHCDWFQPRIQIACPWSITAPPDFHSADRRGLAARYSIQHLAIKSSIFLAVTN
jgi:hypothetical protein